MKAKLKKSLILATNLTFLTFTACGSSSTFNTGDTGEISIPSSNVISSGTYYTVTVPAREEKIFTYTAGSEQYHAMKFTNLPETYYLEIEVSYPNGGTASGTMRPVEDFPTINFTSGGTHYIIFRDRSGSDTTFKFAVLVDEPVTLTAGAAATGKIIEAYGENTFYFEPAASGAITTPAASGTYTITVDNVTGTEELELSYYSCSAFVGTKYIGCGTRYYSLSSGSSVTRTAIGLRTGRRYSIKLEEKSGKSGSYNIAVNAVE